MYAYALITTSVVGGGGGGVGTGGKVRYVM